MTLLAVLWQVPPFTHSPAQQKVPAEYSFGKRASMVFAMIVGITNVDSQIARGRPWELSEKSGDHETIDGASNFARMSLGDKTLDLEIAQHILLREHADLG